MQPIHYIPIGLGVVGIALTILFGVAPLLSRGGPATEEQIINPDALASGIWDSYEQAEMIQCIEGSFRSFRTDALICNWKDSVLLDPCFSAFDDIGLERRWAAVCIADSGTTVWRADILDVESVFQAISLASPADARSESPPFLIELENGQVCWLSSGLIGSPAGESGPAYGCPGPIVAFNSSRSFEEWAGEPRGDARILDMSDHLAFGLERGEDGAWVASFGSRQDATYDRVAVVIAMW